MVEKEVIFISGGVELSGTIALPGVDGPYPAVLFITGSGKIDRNENHKKMPLNAFYDISHYLAENGIASFRYDKRGVGASGGGYWSTGFFDHVNDAMTALEYMRRLEGIDAEKIFLLGHSEGAFISVNIAAKKATTAGIILLAGGAQSGEAVLKWQALEIAKGLKGLNGWIIRFFHIDVSAAQQKALDKIKASKKDCYRASNFRKINAKWLKEFMAYDPSVDFPLINVPVLAITGSKDIQVDPNDLKRMRELVKAPFEGRLIENMTHMLRLEEGGADITKYKEEIKNPVEPQVLEITLSWIKKTLNQNPR